MNVRKEKQIASMLTVGIGMMIGGVFVTALSFVLSMGIRTSMPMIFMSLGLISIVVGVGLAGFGVFSGTMSNKRMDESGANTLYNCYVVGRFEVNELGEMVFSDFDYESPKSKFFVRLKMPDGIDHEYQCAAELMDQIGEGMVGNVQIKGRWLGSFTPVPRP